VLCLDRKLKLFIAKTKGRYNNKKMANREGHQLLGSRLVDIWTYNPLKIGRKKENTTGGLIGYRPNKIQEFAPPLRPIVGSKAMTGTTSLKCTSWDICYAHKAKRGFFGANALQTRQIIS
jgi:hypothetical protein